MKQPTPDSLKKLKEVATRAIPNELKQTRKGGFGNDLTYISGTTCIDMLNEAFDYLWDWEDIDHWMTESVPAYNNKSQKSEPQSPVAHVKGCLTVYFKDDEGQLIPIHKTGIGDQSVHGKQSEQENIWKSASTDAMKKAATKLGLGLELARKEDEQAYFEAQNFDNPWDDLTVNAHREELDYVNNYIVRNKLKGNEIDELVGNCFNNSLTSFDDITPDVLPSFVNWLEDIEKTTKKEA